MFNSDTTVCFTEKLFDILKFPEYHEQILAKIKMKEYTAGHSQLTDL